MRKIILATTSLLVFSLPAHADYVGTVSGAAPSGQTYAYAYEQAPVMIMQPLPAYQAQQQMVAAPAVYQPSVIPNYLPATPGAQPIYATQAGYTVSGQAPVPAAGYDSSTTYSSSSYATTVPLAVQPAYGQPVYAAPVPQAQAQMPMQAPVYQVAQADIPMVQAPQVYAAQPYASGATTTQSSYYQSTTSVPQYVTADAQQAVPAPQPAPQAYYYANQPAVQTYEVAQNGPLLAETTPLLATEPGNENWYFGLRSGFTIPSDTQYKTATATVDNEYKTGWLLGMMLGKSFRPWAAWVAPRLEADVNFSQADIDTHRINGAKTSDPNAYGDVTNFDFLLNGFLDFKLTNKVFPYIGGGVGLGFTDFDRHGTSVSGVFLDDNNFGFAWQAGAGLSFPVANGTLLDVGYRFQQNPDFSLTARDGTKTDVTTDQHMFLLGLRQNF